MWRVDCGFKTGYLNQLESMLELKIPGCGLKASPHIESRVKYFKLKHNVVADMLALSGFGWDSEKSMIVCDKSVYDEYVKKRKDASGLFLKPFPHYYTLSEIFGRDRANGANAGNADDDEEEVRHEDNFNFTLGNDSTHETFMENILDDMSHTPQSHAHANENESVPSNSSHPKKKRRTKDKTFENMSSNMGAMAESISAIVPKLDGLISVLSTADKELSDLQAKLYGEICKIEGLGEQEILDAIDILATKHDMLCVFFNLPNELKKGYILRKIGRGL
ncbi:Myb DNA-bind 3 domain-containing protein [Citrus sinensis]|nr:Myb DNA-bind 3 domain-containing protein [Citrus sinensis]